MLSTKTFLIAVALGIALPVLAHAQDDFTGSTPLQQQREIERTRIETERAEVRNRLVTQGSVAERNYTPGSRLDEPSMLNQTAPSGGLQQPDSGPTQVAPARPTRSSYNE